MSCLAIALDGPKTKNGRRLFENFVEANKQSFWNRDLVSAATSLVYMGFMRPGTLFVSGPSIHLQSLRTAWARRVLKPAEGYQITSLGEMGAIQTVEQMHFVPLGDVICDSIAHLNRLGQPATIAAVRSHVAHYCPHVAPPNIDMVKQTVANLITTGLVYKMGEHFFVSVPAQSPPKNKVTVQCQTGLSIIHNDADKVEKKDRRGIIARIFSKKVSPSTIPTSQPIAFSTQFPSNDWQCNQRLTVLESTRKVIPTKYLHHHDEVEIRKSRRHRKCERRQLSSSSECLNYGPIDPPECLPGHVEVIDDLRHRRRRRTKRKEAVVPVARTSTPVGGSDSAYSPSPVTDSNEEPGSGGLWSEPEEGRVDHTYINLNNHDSTHFEEMPTIVYPSTNNIHVSNV